MVGNAPEFWYTLGSRTIREQVFPAAEGGFELRIQVEGGLSDCPWKGGASDKGFVEVHSVTPGKWRVQFRDRREPHPNSGDTLSTQK
jgi:hypothetical protein